MAAPCLPRSPHNAARTRTSPPNVTCRAQDDALQRQRGHLGRRRIVRDLTLATLLPAVPACMHTQPAAAILLPPTGLYAHLDRLDGYSFFYPNSWILVTTSGNDVFYRNPRVADENVFVDISSPSSSRFASVQDLGSPQAAAERLRQQFLTEYMSTRLGVRRDIEPIAAQERTGSDNKLYYDVAVRVKSFASRQQLAVTDTDREAAIVQEYDRVLITTLGVANQRLYQLRIQTSFNRYNKDSGVYDEMSKSFSCKEV